MTFISLISINLFRFGLIKSIYRGVFVVRYTAAVGPCGYSCAHRAVKLLDATLSIRLISYFSTPRAHIQSGAEHSRSDNDKCQHKSPLCCFFFYWPANDLCNHFYCHNVYRDFEFDMNVHHQKTLWAWQLRQYFMLLNYSLTVIEAKWNR